MVNQLTCKGLAAYDMQTEGYAYIPLEKGEAWIAGCEGLPTLPPLMAAAANMLG